MYAENARNRMLPSLLAMLVVLSLSFNIKQLLDINYYRKMASETEGLLSGIAAVTVKPAINSLKKIPVNKNELQCLAENIYFEAANQSLVGKIAVGQVVLNRLAKPSYPKTVCGVINQKIGEVCMFSWKCEEPKEIANQQAWKQSRQVAYDLLSHDPKDRLDITEGATHFHAVGLKTGWNLKPTAKIDDHLFYK